MKTEKPKNKEGFDTWLKTELGAKCADYGSLRGAEYLRNRLWWAFTAGLDQMQPTLSWYESKKVELQSSIEELQRENDRLKNDLLDALDLKQGKGPTALSMVVAEKERLEKENQELREKIK